MVELTADHGLGILVEDEDAKKLLDKGKDIRHSTDVKELKCVHVSQLIGASKLQIRLMNALRPKREDIISE